jgi:hypothetical protein
VSFKPAFLITIDTEGDDLWSRPRKITTENARWLPRFQRCCEDYGLTPTYLTNYEMAMSPVYQRFARKVLRRGTAEIGMHLHAWNSPPIIPLTDDDYGCAPYLIEYPAEVIRRKVAFMTSLLRDTFGCPITSHRAGRWGFNAWYAQALLECGYRVDCSVTPGVSWTSHAGGLGGGSDYTNAPRTPYFLDHSDVCRGGNSGLLEVPMTVMPEKPSMVDWLRPMTRPGSLAGRVLNRVAPEMTWLQPNGRNLARMLRLLDGAVERGDSYVEFTLHSSELMPGGSPQFRTAESIEALYRDLHALFTAAEGRFRRAALTGFSDEYRAAKETAA